MEHTTDTSPGPETTATSHAQGEDTTAAGRKFGSASTAVGVPPSEKTKDDLQYISGIKLALVLASMTVVFFLMMLDGSILSTAIPFITDEFHSLLDIGWYGSAYQLANAAVTPLAGRIYTRLSSKWCFLAFVFVFELGSLLCGAARSSTMLIVGRAVAGIGGAGLMNGGFIILNSCVPTHRQPALLGIMTAFGFLGLAFGPLIGGAFTQYVSWRWCFYVNLPVGGVMAFVLAALSIPDHIEKPDWRTTLRNAVTEFDLIGFVLFAPASTQFFLALQWGGNQYPWNSSMIIGLFCGAGATFIVFIVWIYYAGDAAMIPLSVLANRAVWSSCAMSIFFVGSIFASSYYLPIYFQVIMGASPFQSGVDVLPSILPQMFMALIVGGLLQQLGFTLPFMLLCGVFNSIGNGLLSLLSPSTSTAQWAGYQVIQGIGRGLGVSVPVLLIQHSLPKDKVPTATSCLVFCQNFGGAIMIVFAQTILTNSLQQLIPRFSPGVDPEAVISAGSTAIRAVVPANALEGVLLAYSDSIDRIFYLCAGISVAALFFSCFMGWVDIRKRDQPIGREGRE